MRSNLELKARLIDPSSAVSVLLKLGANHSGTLWQEDTYLHVSNGRLKLRQTKTDPSHAELIHYNRPNDTAVRPSNYRIAPVIAPDQLKAALTEALGVAAIVRKRRELYLWHNVRIHLDQVENLGNFIEFEAVLSSDADEASSLQRLERLIELLNIRAEDRIACSYSELLQRQTPPPR